MKTAVLLEQYGLHSGLVTGDSLFGGTAATSALENIIEGLDDFELVTFLVVRANG